MSPRRRSFRLFCLRWLRICGHALARSIEAWGTWAYGGLGDVPGLPLHFRF